MEAAAAAAAETHVWRRIILNYSTSSTFKPSPSWDQEKAFAEDIAAVWPPRSYSCNFCMRQFRSAQALGGHMNVHRRDRARLQNNHPRPLLFIKPTPTLDLQTPKINRFSSSHSSAFSPKRPKLSLSSSSSSSSSSNSQDLLDLELKL